MIRILHTKSDHPVKPTSLSFRDAIDETLVATSAKPARAALTVLGTLLGVAAFVCVLGLTATASGQISQRFTALSATEVTIEDAPLDPETAEFPFPVDAEGRLNRLNGVVASGVYWQMHGDSANISTLPPGVATTYDLESFTVTAASPGYFEAVHARLGEGRVYSDFHNSERMRVCVLGRAAAARLGIDRLEYQPAIFVGDTAFTVIGIIDDVDRQAESLLSVIVPEKTAMNTWGAPKVAQGQAPKILIETQLGAAQTVGSQVALALRPDQPDRFKVVVPPDPKQLREQVNTDLSTLFLALAGICLVIGGVGIANTTLVSVMERTGEIGLRRSLGARRRHIAAQFLTESAFLGLLGGLVGTALGVTIVVVVATIQKWTPIIEPLTVLPAPFIGAITGVLAGLYPAWRAGKIEPVEALRR